MLHLVLALGAAVVARPLSAAPSQVAPQQPAQQPAARGFIVGRVIEKETGRALESVNILVIETGARTQSDLDGRFRLGAPAGVYRVRAFRLGYVPSEIDSIRVASGSSTNTNFVLATAAVTLGAVAVTAGPVRANSEDALLAMQKSAPRVSDGISSEAIRRAPGSNAGDAIVRVTGVSVVNNKFAIVRGLSERYSNTLLNGVELPSPEPLRKIVPLDVFPSSLLESIVVSKTATPDKPGDFSGGSVEVTTTEFPNEPVAEASITIGWDANATGRRLSVPRQRGLDFVGFDDGGRRRMPSPLPTLEDGASDFTPASEAFAERLRQGWNPAPAAVLPNFGAGVNIGGRVGERVPFGYAISATLNRQVEATPQRLSQLVFNKATGTPDQGYVSDETRATVDLGAIANFAVRLGLTQKLGFKNLYTRNTDEQLSTSNGYETYNGNAERRIYQSQYVEKSLWQSQLTGEHLIKPLLNSRIEWRATASFSNRDEPENRSLIYFKTPTQQAFTLVSSKPSPLWFRFLDDRVRSGQLDWSLPLDLVFLREGALLKFGGLYRERDRTFTGYFFRSMVSSDPAVSPLLALPPEEIFSGEVLGSALDVRRQGVYTVPYQSDDDIRSLYAMLDLPITSWMRVVGGAREEQWTFNLFNGTRAEPILEPTRQRVRDLLPSVNLTFSLSNRQNVRIAGYRTVARPDPREVSPDVYYAITGDCAYQGNPAVRRATILNGDVRWEFYPAPGELVSLSAFVKDFTDAIGEVLLFTGSSDCAIMPTNFEQARVTGGELEFRKALGFLPGPLSHLMFGANVTLAASTATFRVDSSLAIEYEFQGQSKQLGNLSLLYLDAGRHFDANVFLNYFSDRIVRYGISSLGDDGTVNTVPAVYEKGRLTLDAKIRRRVGNSTISLSGRNLTDNEIVFFQPWDAGITRTGYVRPGVSVSLGVGYDFR